VALCRFCCFRGTCSLHCKGRADVKTVSDHPSSETHRSSPLSSTMCHLLHHTVSQFTHLRPNTHLNNRQCNVYKNLTNSVYDVPETLQFNVALNTWCCVMPPTWNIMSVVDFCGSVNSCRQKVVCCPTLVHLLPASIQKPYRLVYFQITFSSICLSKLIIIIINLHISLLILECK
jgi:hypothetical protein